jgi:molecular chaperone DnaJ
MDAVKGAKKYVTVNSVASCHTCHGSGIKKDKKKVQCSICHGSGIQVVQMGGFHMQTSCQACGGAGSTIPHDAKCNTCDSVGKVRERKQVEVNISPGMDNNSRIRVPGAGDAPIKGQGPNGDLFVSLHVSLNCIGSLFKYLKLTNTFRFNHQKFSVGKMPTSFMTPKYPSTKPY